MAGTSKHLEDAHRWVLKVIESLNHPRQFSSCNKLITNYRKQYRFRKGYRDNYEEQLRHFCVKMKELTPTKG